MSQLDQEAFARAMARCGAPKLTGSKLVLAYSGGLDSSVLLHLASEYARQNQLSLRALHVDHGASEHALKWREFCQAQCAKLDVECVVEMLDLSLDTPNFEHVARTQRLAFFTDNIQSDAALLMAHHQDDQLETMLMRLLRGTGLRGLAAMNASRRLGGARLIRPLLEVSKAAIKDYALRHAIEWVEDESNQNQRFDRNFLRGQVLPLLRARWPQCEQGLLQACARARADTGLLQQLGQLDIAQCSVIEHQSWFDQAVPLCLSKLSELESDRSQNVIDVWILNHTNYPIPRARLREWLRQLEQAQQGSAPRLKHEHIELRYFAGRLHQLIELDAQVQKPIMWKLDGAPLALPALGIELSALRFDQGTTVEVSWRQGGERILQPGRGHSQAYKKCLQQRLTPPWERDYLPLIRLGDAIIWSGVLGALSPHFEKAGEQAFEFAIRRLEESSQGTNSCQLSE